jgi:hypothetical protein
VAGAMDEGWVSAVLRERDVGCVGSDSASPRKTEGARVQPERGDCALAWSEGGVEGGGRLDPGEADSPASKIAKDGAVTKLAWSVGSCSGV